MGAPHSNMLTGISRLEASAALLPIYALCRSACLFCHATARPVCYIVASTDQLCHLLSHLLSHNALSTPWHRGKLAWLLPTPFKLFLMPLTFFLAIPAALSMPTPKVCLSSNMTLLVDTQYQVEYPSASRSGADQRIRSQRMRRSTHCLLPEAPAN